MSRSTRQTCLYTSTIVGALILLAVATANFSLFHLAVDVQLIVLSVVAALLMLGANRQAHRAALVVISGGYLGVATLVFFHMVSHEGMAIVSGVGAGVGASTQFSIAARAFQALSAVTAVLAVRRTLPALPTVAAWLAAAVVLTVITIGGVGLPACDGMASYARLRIVADLTILVIFLSAIGVLVTHPARICQNVIGSLRVAVATQAVAQSMFTFGNGRFADAAGHALMVLAGYVICGGVAIRFLADMFNDVTAELSAKEQARTALLHRLITAQEEERLRLSRELHDEVGQLLTGIAIALGSQDRSELHEERAMLHQLARRALESIRRMARNLRPAALDDGALTPALKRLMADVSSVTHIAYGFQEFGECPLSSEAKIAVYRVVQEGLTNIARHSRASHMSLLIQPGHEEMTIILEDDGVGLDVNRISPGLGFTSMSERLSIIGGTLEVESVNGRGTTLFIRVPESGEACR